MLFAERGVRIERVLTDNGKSYADSHVYAEAIETIGARHKLTWPYRPQTNGKDERFIKTLLAEWAYGELYRSNAERITALPRWVASYNHRRSHTALDGQQPPMTALVNTFVGITSGARRTSSTPSSRRGRRAARRGRAFSQICHSPVIEASRHRHTVAS